MGWFWADTSPAYSVPSKGATPSSCPVKHDAKPSGCPVKHDTPRPSACPVKHDATPSYISKLNPLNYMPSNISNSRDFSDQDVELSLDRENSTIPRGNGSTWEYPSPQQMYNAMLRKGYTDTPAQHVTSMVAVHNFLNEGAWEEIRGWEDRFRSGLMTGWERCSRGEQGAAEQIAMQRTSEDEPALLRFMGRPDEPTPKARMLGALAKIWPSQFPDNPPFDRHDWFVGRKNKDGTTREVRYVIDYYSGPPEPTGEPVFYLDVRPALDGPSAVGERMIRYTGDLWWRATGASVREELAKRGRS